MNTYINKKLHDQATEISVIRGHQGRRDAIIRLVEDLKNDPQINVKEIENAILRIESLAAGCVNVRSKTNHEYHLEQIGDILPEIAYQLKRALKNEEPEQINWKIKRDEYYSSLFYHFGEAWVKDAGFFEDASELDEELDTDVLCTPLPRFAFTIKRPVKRAIALMTGSFCPFHEGHLEMIQRSVNHLNVLGYDEIAVYVSPGHDEYIGSKNKAFAIPVHERIKQIQEHVKDMLYSSVSVMVDPWEGAFNSVAVNFTDVMSRLKLYITRWTHFTPDDIDYFYVCGGDNARFAKTFVLKDNCIVINRPGCKGFDFHKRNLKEHTNIHFVEGDNDMSSTVLRTKEWKEPNKKQLYLRCKDMQEYHDDVFGFVTSISKRFEFVVPSFIDDQIEIVKNGKLDERDDVINLDSELEHLFKNNFKVSRCYDIFGIDKNSTALGFVNRPGSEQLHEQASKMHKKEYHLFDDDIHTGSTMRFCKEMLESENVGLKIKGQLSLTKSNDDSEILDLRDFTLGENSGLVIMLPDGRHSRVPYMYPYVDPHTRASVNDPLQFSIDMWRCNLRMYENEDILISELHHPEVFETVGFDPESSVRKMCQWHIDKLTKLLPS